MERNDTIPLKAGSRYVMRNGSVTGELIGPDKGGFFVAPGQVTDDSCLWYYPIWKSNGQADFFQHEDNDTNIAFDILKEF